MVDQQVDFDTIAADLFTGLAELNLPPRAESALTLLQQLDAEGMRSLVQAQTAYTLLNLVGFVLPWLSLLLITAGVLTARGKAKMLIGATRYLRITVAVLAAVIVLFVRPLTPAVIIWTALLALLVILLIEMRQRPTAEVEAGTAGQGEAIAAEAVPAEVTAEPVAADVSADRPGAARPEPGRSDTD